MAEFGPGKYDALCTEVREKAKAAGAVILVFHGEHGSGFSVQADAVLLGNLPLILRDIANQIEASARKGAN